MSNKRASGRSLDEWMELVTECRQSGLTDAAWCNGKRLIFLSYLKIKRFFLHLVEIDVLKLYNTFKIYLPRGIFIWTNLLSYLTQPMN
jgi:hypothetical protein